MSFRQSLQASVRQLTPENFEATALAVFRWQATHNPIYKEYLHYLQKNPHRIESLPEIPFLPIGFFKRHAILTASPKPQIIFESSGTTGSQTSRHCVADLDWYKTISTQIFETTYGPLSNFHLLALLPSYLERNNSSLVYMVQDFIEKTHSPISAFFLHDIKALLRTLQKIAEQPDGRKVLLWGVTFALLDLAELDENFDFLSHIPELIIMETGGMKGRRRELLRQEVHEILTERFKVQTIHSEYGMTELLSQAYSRGEGVFDTSASMRILLRDPNDPFAVSEYQPSGLRYGGINVIDLANIDSCAFIETQDLGSFVGNNPSRFEVVGRFDNSDLRGCNLMI
ncbi:MAG: acyl transferase [Runella sp.]